MDFCNKNRKISVPISFHFSFKGQTTTGSNLSLSTTGHSPQKISSNPINPSLLLSIFTNVVIADFHFAHIFYTRKPDSHRTELNSWISFFLTRNLFCV